MNRQTVLSGHPKVAPMAAGRPKPMVPIPPEVMMLRLREYLKYLDAIIWFCPTSVTSTASCPVASLTAFTTSPMLSGPSCG